MKQGPRVMAGTLPVLTVLALLGFVSCQGHYGDGNPAPAPQPPTYPPTTSQAHSYPPSSSSPPPPKVPPPLTYPPTSLIPPPPKISPSRPPVYPPPTSPNSPSPKATYPSMSSRAPPPKSLSPSVYPPRSSGSPSPNGPRQPTYPPMRSISPSPKSPQPPAYPPSSLLPPKAPQSPTYPPTSSSSPPPPMAPLSPTYPPASPSPPPPIPSSPPPPTYPPTSPSPPPPIPSSPPTYPPTSPSPPPPMPPPPPSSDDAGKNLMVGYYKNMCGPYVDVEAIIRKYVSSFDDGMKAGLIRLFFHDCFIRGCDASILLDPTSDNPQPEKLGIPNFPSMRGYEVIDAAKAELEATCPGKVSCADIVAFAARDATFFLSGGDISFDMPAGRYDGNVSLAGETLPNLPPPFAGLQQLVKMFADKGLDSFDMVTLSGAHSVGRSHCSSFSWDRLPPSTTSDMDPAFAGELVANCSSATNGGGDNTVAQDDKTPDVLDNEYYQDVLDHRVLFTSDAALVTSNDMASYLVRVYAIFPWLWQQKFAEAMVKMGRIEIKTAATGEIRKTCRVVNSRQ